MKDYLLLDHPESANVWADCIKSGASVSDLFKGVEFTLLFLPAENKEEFIPFFFANLRSIEDVPQRIKAVSPNSSLEDIKKKGKELIRDLSLGQLFRIDLPNLPGGEVFLYFKGNYPNGDKSLYNTARVVVSPKYPAVKALVKKALSGEVVKIKNFTKDTITYQY